MSGTETMRATDPAASAWVSANAGAGKTTLLTDRVTRLLLAGADPARILCLTYTKAAAAEMGKRLFGRLGEWALLPDDKLAGKLADIGEIATAKNKLREARRLFAKALETPGGLKIQTIHSFCQHLLTRFPIEANIPPRFSVLDERSASELMQAARDTVLSNAASDPILSDAIATLSVRTADGRFTEILGLALSQAGKIEERLTRHGDLERLFAHQRKMLGSEPGEDENAVIANLCASIAREMPDWQNVASWWLEGSTQDKKRGASLSEFLAGGCHHKAYASLLSSVLTQKGEPYARIATNERLAANPRHAERALLLQQLVLTAEERRKAAACATLTEAFLRVALAVLSDYKRLKRERAALDYEDLIQATLTLLKTGDAALWVLYKLDGGLEHILIDEAQDTSPEQWEIAGKLAEEFFAGEGRRENLPPRTLFAVGDEKQSIFSFQGARPEGFGKHRGIFKKRADDARMEFHILNPAVSRRSGKAILKFVDAVFENASAADGLTSTGDPIVHEPSRETPGRVEVWKPVPAPDTQNSDPWDAPVDAPRSDSAASHLANQIARRIAGWIKDKAAIPGTEKPVTPGSIMVLIRRRNAFTEEMIRKLMEYGVPVAGADRMVLTKQIAILDLVALGRFALLPEDDLTLAALFKSPLLGLSEDDLFALANPRKGTLWRELSARRAENPAWERAHAVLEDVLAQADFLPPFEFYGRILGKGARARIAARLGEEAEDAMDEFLALALAHESAHSPSLENFLAWFEQGASEIKRDMEQEGGAVRVMTVHGAKGLEADIVIAPDTVQIPEHGKRAGIFFTEDCVFYGMPADSAPIALSNAKSAEQLREMQEYRRLLYVAATRAREWLIVCGYEPKRKRTSDLSWYAHVEDAARRIGREELVGDETILAIGAPLAGTASPAAEKVLPRPKLPAFLSTPAREELVSPRILRPSEDFEEPPPVSPTDQKRRFGRGLLVHALLAELPKLAREDRKKAAATYLARKGLSPDAANALTAEALAILDDPVFHPLFAEGSRAEVPIVASLPELGNVRVSGQIDRLAVAETRVLVADFKTNRPPPSRPQDVSRVYLAQLALYRAALAKIYVGKTIECALVWTHEARLMPVPASLLDEQIAGIVKRIPLQTRLDP
jgi:ATP-dependent helicase/nuclease subunit A